MATISWVNSAGGDFGVAANWSTDSVPFLNDDVTVSAFGQYLVTVSDNDQANSLTFNAPQAALQENAGSLALTGTLLVNSGFLSLNEANRIGAFRITGGVLAFGNTGALGAGTVSMLGGELLATANETLSNALSFYPGTSWTIAAAHGKMMKTASDIDISPGATLDFGNGLESDRNRRLQRRRSFRHPVSKHDERRSFDLGNEWEQCHWRQDRHHRSRVELAGCRNRRLQRRRPFRHSVSKHQRPNLDLGHEREQLDRRWACQRESRYELARGRAHLSPKGRKIRLRFRQATARAR